VELQTLKTMNELIDAVKMGDISKVKELLPANTDPARKDPDGLSPLGAAAEAGIAALPLLMSIVPIMLGGHR
jgi:hypothetical protein